MSLATLAIAISLFAPVRNDGGLNLSGAPKLLAGHPTVQMESEDIRISVRKYLVTADCEFVFRNHDPACDVRMGFPDVGEGAFYPYEDLDPDQDWKSMPIRTTFRSFRSWVNGKPTSTKLIRGAEIGQVFRVKTVHLPANRRVRIRDLYTQQEGASATEDGSYARMAGYVLSTGSSWRGNIGRTTVTFTFEDAQSIPALRFVTDSELVDHPFSTFGPKRLGVFCAGPVKPQVQGNRLIFRLKHWRPNEKSNITLIYRLPPR